MIYALLILTNVLTLTISIVMMRRTLSLIEKMDEISEQIEESLDIINDSYTNVSKHLESPVLFDDPIVVSMIRDIKTARDAMLLIANKVTEPFISDVGSDEEETK